MVSWECPIYGKRGNWGTTHPPELGGAKEDTMESQHVHQDETDLLI